METFNFLGPYSYLYDYRLMWLVQVQGSGDFPEKPLPVEIRGPVTMPLLGPGPAPAVAALGPGTAVPAAVAAPAFAAQAPGVQNMPGAETWGDENWTKDMEVS